MVSLRFNGMQCFVSSLSDSPCRYALKFGVKFIAYQLCRNQRKWCIFFDYRVLICRKKITTTAMTIMMTRMFSLRYIYTFWSKFKNYTHLTRWFCCSLLCSVVFATVAFLVINVIYIFFGLYFLFWLHNSLIKIACKWLL